MATGLNQDELLIYKFVKSSKEEVRISETIYLDRPFIDVRIFHRRADGTWQPTKRGITVSKDVAKNLIDGFAKIDFQK